MRPEILVVIILSMFGCSYNGYVQDSSLYTGENSRGRLPGKVTLIEDKTNIDNIDLKIDAMTLSYNLKDAYFDASKRMLESVFSSVDVAPAPDPNSDYYAVPTLKWASETRGGAFDRGVEVGIGPGVNLYSTKTRSLIKRYTVKTSFNHEKGATTKSMMVLNGATLFLASPIAVNVAAQSEGKAAQPKLENAIRSSLASIQKQMLSSAGETGTIATRSTVIQTKQADCIDQINKDPELDILRGKLFSASSSRFDMIANKSKPTKEEKYAIRIFHDRLMGCFKIYETAIENSPPEVLTLFSRMRSSLSNQLVALYGGEISYGAYVQKSGEAWEGFQQDATRIFAEEARQNRAENLALAQMQIQSDAANQQARATAQIVDAQRESNWMQYFQNIQQNMLQKQTINSINGLKSRNSPINCTSSATGLGSVNTSCY